MEKCEMNFPIFEGNLLPKIRELIEGKDEFILVEKDDFFVVDYVVNFPGTFPDLSEPDAAWYREFRGLILHKDGTVARRPFHKFFNYGEKLETYELSLDNPHVIMMKLDGSMISPFVRPNGEIYWATKMGAIDFHNDVKEFVENSSIPYDSFAKMCYNFGQTPIFEWVSPKNKIVVQYNEPSLILTAVRDMATGSYHIFDDFMSKYESQFGIPVVQTVGSFADFDSLKDHTSNLEGEEGYVVSFNDGSRVKMKGDWYCQLHKVKSYFDYEKDVVKLILENQVDDLVPLLDDASKKKLAEYEHLLHCYINTLTNEVFMTIDDKISKKEFALTVKDTKNPIVSQIIFKIWDNMVEMTEPEIFQIVVEWAIKNTSSHGKWQTFKQINKNEFSDSLVW
jgi:RNA ligase